MESLEFAVAKTTKKYDPDRLIESFNQMRNDIEPHHLDDSWLGWALKSADGSIESGLWGYHVTQEMRDIYKSEGLHPDKNFSVPTEAYKYFDWILDDYPNACRARIINTGKTSGEQIPHRDGRVYRFTVPIMPSDEPFLECTGSDVMTAYEVGALYILNGFVSHRPLVNENMDRYHLMFSVFAEDFKIKL